MATRTSTIINPTNAANAIRDWAQFVEDTLVTTGGWVVTSDTGQTLPSALVTPGSINTKAGYRIYRMDDSLQSTYPVFIRFDFGCAGSVSYPGIWLTIGTGSNGTGTITGKLFDGAAATNPQVSAGAATSPLTNTCYGSAANNRVSIALFVAPSTNNYTLVLTIERTKDSSGADTGDGLLMTYMDIETTGFLGYLSYSRYVRYVAGQQPTLENGLSYILPRQNPSETFGSGDVGAGVLIHFKGTAQQPGTNVMITNASDVSAEGSFSLTLYGASRTYQNIRILARKAIVAGNAADGNTRINIRYD